MDVATELPKPKMNNQDRAKRGGENKKEKGKRIDLSRGITLGSLLATHTQCCFLMQRKGRLCNLGRTPGTMYCGNHLIESQVQENISHAQTDAAGGAAGVETPPSHSTVAPLASLPAASSTQRIQKQLHRSRMGNDPTGPTDAGELQVTRIPCPIDPSHSVYAHRLAAHLRVCNTGIADAMMRKERFYCWNCNSGKNDSGVPAPPAAAAARGADSLPGTSTGTGVALSSVPPVDLDALLRKVRELFARFVEPELLAAEGLPALTASAATATATATAVATDAGSGGAAAGGVMAALWAATHNESSDSNSNISNEHGAEEEEGEEEEGEEEEEEEEEERETEKTEGSDASTAPDMRGGGKGNRKTASSFRKDRHSQQEQRICAEMEKASLLSSTTSGVMYIELGAGRGGLGYAVQQHAPLSSLVLVERCGIGKKKDKNLRVQEAEGRFVRARMDIRHCLLSGLPGYDSLAQAVFSARKAPIEGSADNTVIKQLPEVGVVVLAKHLCGVATDLAIHSLRDPTLVAQKMPVGLAVASCCHHCCNWEDYSGRGWLAGIPQAATSSTSATTSTAASASVSTLASWSITAEEFAVLVHWSGWATGLASIWSGRTGSKHAVLVSAADDKVDTGAGAGAGTGRGRGRGTGTGAGAEAEAGTNSQESANAGIKRKAGQSDTATKEKGPTRHTKSSQINTGPAEERGNAGVPRPTDITPQEMAITGFMVKRLLDHGRVTFLRSLGLHAKQVRFCSPKLTPECYLILANTHTF